MALFDSWREKRIRKRDKEIEESRFYQRLRRDVKEVCDKVGGLESALANVKEEIRSFKSSLNLDEIQKRIVELNIAITELAGKQEALQSIQAKEKGIFKSAAKAVTDVLHLHKDSAAFELNYEGRIRRASGWALDRERLGYKPGELIGTFYTSLLHPIDVGLFEEKIRDRREKEDVTGFEGEVGIRYKDREVFSHYALSVTRAKEGFHLLIRKAKVRHERASNKKSINIDSNNGKEEVLRQLDLARDRIRDKEAFTFKLLHFDSIDQDIVEKIRELVAYNEKRGLPSDNISFSGKYSDAVYTDLRNVLPRETLGLRDFVHYYPS